MKRFSTIIGALLGLLLVTAEAHAAPATNALGDRNSIEPRQERTTIGPNRSMLRSGVWTLGLSYVPAAIVAIESPLPADDHLYVPVAGPWLDYANRDCQTCEHEGLNKAMLVTDGVVQGIGALQIIGSFLFVETRTTSATNEPRRKVAAPRFKVTPAKLGSAFGLAATGRF